MAPDGRRFLSGRLEAEAGILAEALKRVLMELADVRGGGSSVDRRVSDAIGECESAALAGLPTGDEELTPENSMLVSELFRMSRFAIDPGEMSAFHRPDLSESFGEMPLQFVSRFDSGDDSCRVSCTESFVSVMYADDMERSVREFDEKVASMRQIRFLTKERVEMDRVLAAERFRAEAPSVEKCIRRCSAAGRLPTAAEILRQVASDGRRISSAESSCGKDGKARSVPPSTGVASEKPVGTDGAAGMPSASALKRLLIGGSRYRIPVKRLKVMQGRKDAKSRRYVYELRFFQKDYSKTPADTQSYESAVLRIPTKEFDPNSAVSRFDKAVSELKFNEFQERK